MNTLDSRVSFDFSGIDSRQRRQGKARQGKKRVRSGNSRHDLSERSNGHG